MALMEQEFHEKFTKLQQGTAELFHKMNEISKLQVEIINEHEKTNSESILYNFF